MVDASLVGLGGVLMGGFISGGIALLSQHLARKADDARWAREVTDRERARFHERRIDAYTNLIEWSSNAFGYLFEQARQRQVQSGQPPTAHDLARLLVAVRTGAHAEQPLEHPEFNQDAARHMIRACHVVVMVSASSEVKEAANELVDAVLAVPRLQPQSDVRAWDDAATRVLETWEIAKRRFLDASNAEVTMAGGAASVVAADAPRPA